MKFYFCEKCGTRVTDQELARGAGRDKKANGVYCRKCADGVMTAEFEAIKNVPLAVEPARVPQPAARASALRIDPARHERKPASGQRRGTWVWSVAVGAGGMVGLLVLAYLFGGSTPAPPTRAVPAPVTPAGAAAPSALVPNPAASPTPTLFTPATATAPTPLKEAKPPVPALAEKRSPESPKAAEDEPSTLSIDFQKEAPLGMDGFESGAAPAGAAAHPVCLRPKNNAGYCAAQINLHTILNGSSKTNICLKTAADSVLRVHVYGEGTDTIGLSLVEGRSRKWHAFSQRIKLPVKNAWTWLEVPFSNLKDGESAPAPGTPISLMGVAAWGPATGYSIWIDHVEVIERAAAATNP